jgi:hypothetical protein
MAVTGKKKLIKRANQLYKNFTKTSDFSIDGNEYIASSLEWV